MRDEQNPNQDEANIPDSNKQTDSLEESLREYQERKRKEFQLNISGLDDIHDDSPEIYSKKSEYDIAVSYTHLDVYKRQHRRRTSNYTGI